MRLIRDGLIALVTGFVIAAVAASVNPHHLARILWVGAAGTFVALVVVLWVDWKRVPIRRALVVLLARFPIAIRIERRRRVPQPANATPAERGLSQSGSESRPRQSARNSGVAMPDWNDVMRARDASSEALDELNRLGVAVDRTTGAKALGNDGHALVLAVLDGFRSVCLELRALAVLIDHVASRP